MLKRYLLTLTSHICIYFIYLILVSLHIRSRQIGFCSIFLKSIGLLWFIYLRAIMKASLFNRYCSLVFFHTRSRHICNSFMAHKAACWLWLIHTAVIEETVPIFFFKD